MSEDSRAKSTGERRANFRGRSAPARRVDVTYKRADGSVTITGERHVLAVAANIGVGGAFLLTEMPEEVGCQLEISLHVPDRADEILVQAEVRWVKAGDAETGGGMGVKFAPFDVEALLILREYFSNLDK